MRDLLKSLTPQTLAAYFDHTLLRANATLAEFETLCEQSREYGFKMVAVNSAAVTLCKKLLHASPVHVGAAIAFPLGQMSIEGKVAETQDALENGADEIDYVINITQLKAGNFPYIEEEMARIVATCQKHGAISKVILENCYLTNEEKRIMCGIACNVGIDFVKTSTGFGTGGATLEDLRLMKEIVGDRVEVKASGGIRTLSTALDMLKIGVTRIGSTASVGIVEELKKITA